MAMTACMVAIGVVVAAVVSISMFVEPVYRYLYGPLQAAAVFALAALLGAAIVTVRSPGSLDVPHVEWVALAVVPVAVLGVVMTIPREDADTPGRRDLRVEAVVGMALDERPGWEQVEGVQLDFRGIGDLEAEVLDVVDRSGRDARSRRSELGLPAPDRVDGVFVVAMDPNRDCFASEPDVAEILTGTSGAGETFSVYAVDRASSAYDRCLRP